MATERGGGAPTGNVTPLQCTTVLTKAKEMGMMVISNTNAVNSLMNNQQVYKMVKDIIVV